MLAGQLLSQAYDKGQQNKDQVKDDVQTGRDRGQQQAERAQAKLSADSDSNPAQDGLGSEGAIRR